MPIIWPQHGCYQLRSYRKQAIYIDNQTATIVTQEGRIHVTETHYILDNFGSLSNQHLSNTFGCRTHNLQLFLQRQSCWRYALKWKYNAISWFSRLKDYYYPQISAYVCRFLDHDRNDIYSRWMGHVAIDRGDKCHVYVYCPSFLWPLLLTWFNFNPSMDK